MLRWMRCLASTWKGAMEEAVLRALMYFTFEKLWMKTQELLLVCFKKKKKERDCLLYTGFFSPRTLWGASHRASPENVFFRLNLLCLKRTLWYFQGLEWDLQAAVHRKRCLSRLRVVWLSMRFTGLWVGQRQKNARFTHGQSALGQHEGFVWFLLGFVLLFWGFGGHCFGLVCFVGFFFS